MSFKFGKKNAFNSNDASLNASLDLIFDKYIDEECVEKKLAEDTMSSAGFVQFNTDIGLDLEDIRVLVLFWRLGALKLPSTITRQEFIAGMKSIGKNNLDQLIAYLPSLDVGFLENDEFREFFKFVYDFNREEKEHKFLDKEICIDLLKLVVDSNRCIHLNKFLEFLATKVSLKSLTKDQWDSFYLFSQTIDLDCSNYDQDSAWPLLLDEYVDWRQNENKKTTIKK